MIFAGDPLLPTCCGYLWAAANQLRMQGVVDSKTSAPGTGGCFGVCQQAAAAAANQFIDRGAEAAHAAPRRHYWLQGLTACTLSE